MRSPRGLHPQAPRDKGGKLTNKSQARIDKQGLYAYKTTSFLGR